MKTLLVIALSLFSFLVPSAVAADDDVAAIKETIVNAYVKAIHESYDAAAMEAGFNQSFIMFILRDGKISHLSRNDWMARMAGAPAGQKRNIKYEIPLVDVAGNTAAARIEIYRDDVHLYTDYMLLYKVEGKWQITGKSYHSHK